MRIFRVTVLSHFFNSPEKFGVGVPGVFQAYGEKGLNDIYYVEHTSPYYNNGSQVGLISLPPKDSQILVCQTDDMSSDRRVYYLTTLTAPQPSKKQVNKTTANTPPSMLNKIYGRLGQPDAVVLAGPGSHSLEIKNDVSEEAHDTGIYLKTGGGKLIRLEDGPQKNNIVIKTADGAFGELASIELQEIPDSRTESYTPSYSVSIYATGSVSIFSQNSNIDMAVEDGGQINIENKSSGLYGAYPGDPTCGTINIKSLRGDINIIAGPDPLTGNVGPVPPDPIASVNITAAGGPLTSLNVHTDGILNLSGGAGVRIAGGDLRLGVTGTAPVVIDGVSIDLNTAV